MVPKRNVTLTIHDIHDAIFDYYESTDDQTAHPLPTRKENLAELMMILGGSNPEAEYDEDGEIVRLSDYDPNAEDNTLSVSDVIAESLAQRISETVNDLEKSAREQPGIFGERVARSLNTMSENDRKLHESILRLRELATDPDIDAESAHKVRREILRQFARVAITGANQHFGYDESPVDIEELTDALAAKLNLEAW